MKNKKCMNLFARVSLLVGCCMFTSVPAWSARSMIEFDDERRTPDAQREQDAMNDSEQDAEQDYAQSSAASSPRSATPPASPVVSSKEAFNDTDQINDASYIEQVGNLVGCTYDAMKNSAAVHSIAQLSSTARSQVAVACKKAAAASACACTAMSSHVAALKKDWDEYGGLPGNVRRFVQQSKQLYWSHPVFDVHEQEFACLRPLGAVSKANCIELTTSDGYVIQLPAQMPAVLSQKVVTRWNQSLEAWKRAGIAVTGPMLYLLLKVMSDRGAKWKQENFDTLSFDELFSMLRFIALDGVCPAYAAYSEKDDLYSANSINQVYGAVTRTLIKYCTLPMIENFMKDYLAVLPIKAKKIFYVRYSWMITHRHFAEFASNLEIPVDLSQESAVTVAPPAQQPERRVGVVTRQQARNRGK